MKKSLLTKGCTAATTLALAASLVPTPALAEAAGTASGNQGATATASEAESGTSKAEDSTSQESPAKSGASEASSTSTTKSESTGSTSKSDSTGSSSTQGASGSTGEKSEATGTGTGPTGTSTTAVAAKAKAKAVATSATTETQTVTLDANGGTVASGSVKVGSPLPSATREGYTFLGWTVSKRAAIESTSAKETFTVDWWKGDAAPVLGEKPESIDYTTGSTGTLYALWARDGVCATYTRSIFGFKFSYDLDKPQTGTLSGDIAAKTAGSDSFDTQSDKVIQVDGKSTVTLRSYLSTDLVKKQLKSATSYISLIQSPNATFKNPTEVMLRDLKSSFSVSYVLDGLSDPTNYSLHELTGDTLSDSSLYALGTPTLTKDAKTGLYTISVPIVLKRDYATFKELQDAVSQVGDNLVLDLDATVDNVTATHVIRGTVGGSMTAVAVFSRGKADDGNSTWWTYKYALPFSFTWTGVQGDFPEASSDSANKSGADSTLKKDTKDEKDSSSNASLPIQLTMQSTYVPDPTPTPTPTPAAKPATTTPAKAATAKAAPAKQAKATTKTATKTTAKATKTAVPKTGDDTTSAVPALAGAVTALAAALGISRRKREE